MRQGAVPWGRVLCHGAGCCAMGQDAVSWGRMLCYGAGCCAMGQGAVLWGRMLCYGAGCCAMGQGAVLWGRVLCHGAGYCAMRQGAVPWGRVLCRGAGCCAMGQGAVPWGRVLCYGAECCAMGQGAVPWGRVLCRGTECCAMGQGAVPWGRVLCHGAGCCAIPSDAPQDWPRQWKAKLKQSPADLSLVSGLFSCLLSFPEHPIAQLLRQLQCMVYTRLYLAISRGAADSAMGSPASLGSIPLDAGGSVPTEPGIRRLRTSRSLHCMFSVPEHGTAGLRHSSSSTPLAAAGTPKAEGGWTGPAPQTPRESSFEDLERFLASPEGWAPTEPMDGPGAEATLPEQLKGIVRDIHNAIDRLLSLTLLAFEGLNTAAGKDQCLACLEEAFFPPLWAPLLALYRSVHQTHEAALARSMERHRHAGPTDMGLASRLLPTAPSCPAYGSAIEDLRLIPLETCPRRKLECIVRALRGICECAEEYCGARDRRTPVTAAIGADDLLPILSYVVLQTGLPQLLSECAALEEFIHEGCLIGEEGYCLTSLQSALSYVESLQ
uniref:Uncharacterized protein n=1 Tax=Melopsittacus undulatus TaxID=13146 RepID=A0A8V5H196_MELUD